MSEGSFWPKTWREAIPLLIWGVLIFAAGFEGVANLVHGQWVSSGISFTIMVGLTAMLLHWERLLAINPNWLVGAVMLVLLGVILSPVPDRWPFVGQWFGVGGIVVLAATAVLAIFYYLRRKRIISGDRFQATGTIE